MGAKVTLNDRKNKSEVPEYDSLVADNVNVILGKQDASILDDDFDLMVKNPGIPYDNPVVEKAEQMDIPIIVEVQLASEITDAELIGVTGSNGKTTTTTMINKMLNANRTSGKSYVAGNIGVPATQVAANAGSKDSIVMELSSFMLLGITSLHPHIAVLTNIFFLIT